MGLLNKADDVLRRTTAGASYLFYMLILFFQITVASCELDLRMGDPETISHYSRGFARALYSTLPMTLLSLIRVYNTPTIIYFASFVGKRLRTGPAQ